MSARTRANGASEAHGLTPEVLRAYLSELQSAGVASASFTASGGATISVVFREHGRRAVASPVIEAPLEAVVEMPVKREPTVEDNLAEPTGYSADELFHSAE